MVNYYILGIKGGLAQDPSVGTAKISAEIKVNCWL